MSRFYKYITDEVRVTVVDKPYTKDKRWQDKEKKKNKKGKK